MRLLRRRFLKLFVGVAGLCGLRTGLAAVIRSEGERDPYAALPAWVDTLIPADPGPGARALGIYTHLIGRASQNARYRRLLQVGCRWLERRAQEMHKTDFGALTEPQRTEIARRAEQMDRDEMPNLFLRFTLQDVKRHYYSDPRSWASLGFTGPPQPKGYPRHTEPPDQA